MLVTAKKLALILCLENTLVWNKNFVFPYLNAPLKSIEHFYQQLFMGLSIITSQLPVIS